MAGSTTPSTVAGRISLLLARSSASEADIASALELGGEMTVADVLHGRRELSPGDLVAVADVLDVPVTVLSGQLPMDRHLGVSLRLGSVAAPDVPSTALELADRIFGHQALLDSWLGRVRNPLAGVSMSTDTFYLRAGQTSAARVRDALGLGNEPVGDLVALVEGLGFPVIFQPLPEGINGLNLRDEREGEASRLIVISTGGPWTMQRYTLSHELAHALYDDDDQVIVDRVDVPEVLPELRAESFARHLLLPTDALRRAVLQARSQRVPLAVMTAQIIVGWGLSRRAVVRALVSDRLVAEAEVQPLLSARVSDLMAAADLDEEYRRLSEGQSEASGSPMLVERAARGFGNGWVSADVVADLMGVDATVVLRELKVQGWDRGASD
jgi:hypothetical protein